MMLTIVCSASYSSVIALHYIHVHVGLISCTCIKQVAADWDC